MELLEIGLYAKDPVAFKGPEDIHLDKRGITLRDPDGLRVLIQSPTEASPEWLKQMVQ